VSRGDRERPSEPLYEAVALGMWAYSRAAFRARTLFPPGFVLRRGSMLVATHRAESDVPVICASIFLHAGVWRRGNPRLHFAARDDLFERGFFAGFPAGLPTRLRGLLWRIDAGPYLPLVRVNPLPYPSAETLRLASALGELAAEEPLAELIPSEALADLRQRARAVGLPEPLVAGDVVRGEFADVLWQGFSKGELAHPSLAAVWRQRSEVAASDLRQVVEVIRSGEPMLFFPEGRPSPDGAIGPLRPGMRLLVRRGRPETLQAIGLAYDPMTLGRPYVYVATGPEIPAPADDVDEAVLVALRRALPLTVGQVVAGALLEASKGPERVGVAALDDLVGAQVARAAAERRPVDPKLREREQRREMVSDALRWALRASLARRDGAGAVALDVGGVVSNRVLDRLAREHASATSAPGE
jgi:1-acyl-sn-glycerol-3-phosphate acyltransferase